ncbi:hypothetical protein TH61_00490 [Rufibacter sp. DG15C]|uniref:Arm DNA-binding domain-containing protein n=1 Tax=Rufibacter sp. DG15C TaxID=1379909 RepID=UPI00078E0732|nr:Arm DNA-binding domain-containing protein [Rufibacter sp. DG15C]AMM49958.1 hypothetical protein TH61_00490 [Rufibacter sp. DG15C]
MKTYTIKAIIQKINTKGLAPLSVQYTYDRKKILIPVGVSVPPSHFDAKKGMMIPSKPNAVDINDHIRKIEKVIAYVANCLSEPVRESVKEGYYIRLEEVKREEEESAQKFKKEKLNAKISDVITHFDFTDAVEEKQKHLEGLKNVNKKLQEFKGKGLYENIEEQEQFIKYLKDYPNKFDKKQEDYIKKDNKQKDQIQSWVNIVLEFSKETKTPLIFSEMNDAFYTAYAEYLLYVKDYYNSTLGTAVNRFKTFLNYVQVQYNVVVNQAYKKWERLEDEPPVVYLTVADLNKLYHEYRELPGITPAKKKLIDTIVFQNLCGFRYSDVKASNWTVKQGYLMGYPKKQYKLKAGKKIKPYMIPFELDERIEEILKRYKFNMNHYAEATFNRMMKDLMKDFFERYELYQEEVSYVRYKFHSPVKFKAPMYKLFSSHSCRKGFINKWAAILGDDGIMQMLGSSSMKELQRYKDKSPEKLLSDVRAKLYSYKNA